MNNRTPELISTIILWLVLVGGLLLSYLSFQIALKLENRNLQAEQNRITHLVSDALSRELEISQSVLEGIRGLFLASSFVSRNEFFLFTETVLKVHPSIQAMEWVPRVVDKQREEFRQRAFRDGLTDFNIWERNPQGQIVSAQQRPEYFPVFYVEPLINNETALGFDLASSEERRFSLSLARQSRQAQATASIKLVQTEAKEKGFLIFQPIYIPTGINADHQGEIFNGFAVGVFKINSLLETAIEPFKSDLRLLRIEFTDITNPDKPDLLLSLGTGSEHKEAFSPATSPVNENIQFANRSWKITSSATTEFLRQNAGLTHWLIFISGCILTLLITGYLKTLMRRDSEIRRLVQQQTNELRHSEMMSRTILENTVDAVITINEAGIVSLFNPAAEKMFAYSSNEVIGENVKMLMPEPYQSEHDGYLKRHQQTGEDHIIGIGREVTGLRKDGEIFPINLSVGRTFINNKPLYVATITDLTELKNKEQALRDFRDRLNLATQAGGIGVWDFDLNSGAMNFDDRMYEIYGVNRGVFLNTYKAWFYTLHPEDRARTEAEINRAIMGGKHLETEFRILWRDGQVRYIQASGLVLFNDKGHGYRMIGVNLDITERKRTEETIAIARQAAEAADRQKSAFMDILSHELRTPLTVILGYLPLLKNNQEITSTEAITQIAEDMELSGQLLLEKIYDLLDISRIDAGQIKFDVVEIESLSLIMDMLRQFNDQAQQKGIQLVSDADGFDFHADEKRLRQILNNLIGNAIKFTPEGMVKISASRDDEFVSFSVKDTGVGIPESEQQLFFETTRQNRQTVARDGKDTDLSMTITRRLVELQGGTIQVKSKPGMGTTFTFTIRQ